MSDRGADPFTLEIIKEGVVAAAEESFVTLGRTSKSTIIYEVLDYACGLMDPKGDLIAQADGVPGFIGLLIFTVREALEKFGAEGLQEGDIVISNVPYTSGTHLSDVAMCMPIYHGEELVAFSANKAHWTEVGGKDPGSWTTDSTEIYQEGLQFPAVRLYEEGEPNEALIDLIRANVRLPEMSLGDMHAQVASLRVAERRVRELCRKYGLDAVRKTIGWYMEYGEEVARKELQKLPKGTFRAEDWIDDDGVTDEPIPVRVTVTIDDDDFLIDYSGTGPQSIGPVNCTLPATVCAARKIYKAVTDPHLAMNEGCFRPLKVVVPEGSIFNATHPAPTSIYWESMVYASDIVWKALAPHLPDRLTAGHFLSSCGTLVGGRDDATGATFILVEPQAGGWGAGRDKDGEKGLVVSSDGETFIIPVEVCEQRFPLRVERYAFNQEEGGSGEYRGGNGLIREYRVLGRETFVTGTFGRFKFPPWGMAGGEQGTGNRMEIHRASEEQPMILGKAAREPLMRGDRVVLVTGVGGGYGNPLNRDPKRVLADVLDEFLTEEAARRIYGAIVDAEAEEVRGKATERLREEMRPSASR